LYLKAKRLYYRVHDNLSINLETLVSTLEPENPANVIVLNDFNSYELVVNYAVVSVHTHQFDIIIKGIISSIFKTYASHVKMSFEPRNKLVINLTLGTLLPVKIKGQLVIDEDKNTIVYKFDQIKAMGLPVNSLLEAIKSIPGLSIAYKTEDTKAKLENDQIEIYIDKFIPDLRFKYTLSDCYFSDKGINIELRNKTIYQLENKLSVTLPESYATFLSGRLKVGSIDVNDAKILVKKSDGEPFAFNFAAYRDIVESSTIEFNDKEELILTITNASVPATIEETIEL
jgi:hypothetical protein